MYVAATGSAAQQPLSLSPLNFINILLWNLPSACLSMEQQQQQQQQQQQIRLILYLVLLLELVEIALAVVSLLLLVLCFANSSHLLSFQHEVTATLPEDDAVFEVIIEVNQKKTSQKRAKPNPLQIGPFNVKFASTWESFLAKVASVLKVVTSVLKVNTFQWRLQKPKTSPLAPITNEEGFISLLRKLQAHKSVNE